MLGLALLLVPLLAHLRRANEASRVDFAALRWLQPRRRPRRRLRLRDWLLLVLRLLLVAALALLLAEPARVERGAAPAQVYVDPSLDAAQARATWPALPGDTQWHWLAPGFPPLDAPAPRAPASAATASLLREADARTPAGAALHVLVPATVTGLDGTRPRVAHRIDWRVAPDAGVAHPQDIAPPAHRAPRLVLVGADADSDAARVLRAVAIAWAPADAPGDAAARFDVLPANAPLPAHDARLVWLGARAPPTLQDWIAGGGTALLVPPAPSTAEGARTIAWRRDDGTVLADAQPIGRGRLLRLRVAMTPAALPERDEAAFPAQLARLFDGPPAAPTRGPAAALRPLAGGPRFATPPTPLAPWFALAVALLFLLERLVATRARREAGA